MATRVIHTIGAGLAPPANIMAIHCSGADGGQWRRLAEHLGPGFRVDGLNLYGTRAGGRWCGDGAFRMSDEARPILASIDASEGDVHLIGHSYGGAVALYVATQRPDRVASLALYEPSAFHVLGQLGAGGQSAHEEIKALARASGEGLVTGDYQRSAAAFVEYWNGAGSWMRMKPEVRAMMTEWLPKAPLDFHAALGDTTPLAAYARLDCPTLILCGQYAMAPSRLIAEALATTMPRARLAVIPNAGHMGPLTHADRVNGLLKQHLLTVAAEAGVFVEAA